MVDYGNRFGLGCMGMSGAYGASADADGIATIHAAMERGVTLLDTGDFYGAGHNEMLIGRAIAGKRDRLRLSVKFAGMRGPDGQFIGLDARPIAVRNFLAYSLTRLGVDHVDVYRPGRLDPAVPIEDTIGAIARLVEEGYVREIGLSEVGADTIRRAHAVHPIADLQIEYSLGSRAPEAEIFPVLRELGIGATLYGVLSRGLLAGSVPQGPTDFRAYLPRFTGENAERNAHVVTVMRDLAAARGMTPGQLAIAWVVAKQPGFTPLVGARTVAQLDDALGALDRVLAPADVAILDGLTLAGERYPVPLMAHLDSERSTSPRP